MTTRHGWWLALLLSSTLFSRASEQDWFVPLGPPPEASQRRINGGEGFPPLPLPATPLRRTERKREPSPPKLIAKVVWGKDATFTYNDGVETRIADWNLCPGDLQQLMKLASDRLGVTYGADSFSLASFDGDPAKTPILFFSGVRTIKFSPQELDLLRSYVLRGGMIVADSIAGSPYFYDSFRAAMEQAFPELGFQTIPPDHPLYHMLMDVDTVSYPQNLDSRLPMLEGMYVYSRVGVLISKYGLGCGWDGHGVPLLKQAIYYDPQSADNIGVNLIAYAIGYARLGRADAAPELYGALDEKRPTDQFVFAQIEHDGDWNVESGAASRLLEELRKDTSLQVSLKRVPVQPGRDDLSSFTFLYLTGLGDFHWDSGEVAALRHFLDAGGTLLINNGLGLRTFDAAARRELKKVLPESDLAPLPASSPVFNSVFKISDAHYTPAVLAQNPGLNQPQLEGISLQGDVKVIYSPFDLEAGWQGMDHPLAKAYAPDTALKLGVNIVMYAMTH
ncbi:MAG TPA: DUF4159 domain-containing protein [Candidatus Sulfotelmatobacter sp.]|nr:DUF4159 domain-containing protein [Candidatus Sulfotelmatobacter sp.]